MKLHKVHLLDLCKQNKPAPITLAQVLAKEYGVEVLYLPVAHPELNRIERHWARMKMYVKQRNQDFSLAKVEQLTKEALAEITKEDWQSVINMAIDEENQYLDVSNSEADLPPIELPDVYSDASEEEEE